MPCANATAAVASSPPRPRLSSRNDAQKRQLPRAISFEPFVLTPQSAARSGAAPELLHRGLGHEMILAFQRMTRFCKLSRPGSRGAASKPYVRTTLGVVPRQLSAMCCVRHQLIPDLSLHVHTAFSRGHISCMCCLQAAR